MARSIASAPRRSLFQFYVSCPVATHVAAMSTQACRWRTFVNPAAALRRRLPFTQAPNPPSLPPTCIPVLGPRPSYPEMYSGDRVKLLAIPDSCPIPLRSLSQSTAVAFPAPRYLRRCVPSPVLHLGRPCLAFSTRSPTVDAPSYPCPC